MFFDTQGPDKTYKQLLTAVASKQKELLRHSFNWADRTEKTIPKKRGFFGRKETPDPVYTRLLDELETIRVQLKTYREKQGYSRGVFWWSIPWDQVQDWLICDLAQPRESGGWRYANELHTLGEDGVYLLYLKEEGHLSDFSSSYEYSVDIKSEYSYSERKDMVRNYNKRLSAFDLMHLSTSNSAPVRSVVSGIDYASKADYYLSEEYFMTRQYLSDSYSKSLYTEIERNGITAVSRSLHYECFFQVADFHVRENGILDHIGIRDFELIRANGNIPASLDCKYEGRDAIVVCAGYLADSDLVQTVPLALFGRDITQGAASYEEAMQQAEIYTCLAEKIQS